jgi:hypothetical protein
MEEKFKRLAGQIARALNVSEQTVADYAESEEAIKGLGTAFKDFRAKVDTDGYNRANERIKRDVEKALRAKGVENPDLDRLDESLDQLATVASAKNPQTLSEEDLKKLPAVKKLLTEAENEKMLAVSEAGKKAEEQLKTDRENFAKEQQGAKVEAQARKLIAELNPNLNPDSAKAERQVSRLLADLKAGQYKQEADGSLAPVDADGKYLGNGAGGNKSFAELVRETVTAEYDLPASTAKDSPGVTAGDVARTDGTYAGPKTQVEYEQQLYLTAPGSAERTKLMDGWKDYKEKNQPAA